MKVIFKNLRNLERMSSNGEIMDPKIEDPIPKNLKIYINGEIYLGKSEYKEENSGKKYFLLVNEVLKFVKKKK